MMNMLKKRFKLATSKEEKDTRGVSACTALDRVKYTSQMAIPDYSRPNYVDISLLTCCVCNGKYKFMFDTQLFDSSTLMLQELIQKKHLL